MPTNHKKVNRSRKVIRSMRGSKKNTSSSKRFLGFIPTTFSRFGKKTSSKPAPASKSAPAPKKLTRKQLRKIIQNSRNFNASMKAMVERHKRGLELQKEANFYERTAL
jgi:predicted transglutaminase-like cysteine proteinase